MALSLLRARLCSTGIVKAAVVGNGNNFSKAVVGNGDLSMVRRFSAAGAGSYLSDVTAKPTYRYAAFFLGLAGWSYALVSHAERYADSKLAEERSKSSQAETTKAEVLRYVDEKLAESARSTRSSSQAETTKAEVLRYVDDVISECARSNRLMVSQWRAADERKFAEIGREMTSVRLELRDVERKTNSELSQLKARVTTVGDSNPGECVRETATMRQELRSIEWKLKSALTQINCTTSKLNSTLSQLERKVDVHEHALNQLVDKQERYKEGPKKKEKMD